MTEEEKMKFWGELVEPILALTGGLLMRGEDKLLLAFRDIVAKAETAALEEREACARVAEDVVPRHTQCGNKIAAAIRARREQ